MLDSGKTNTDGLFNPMLPLTNFVFALKSLEWGRISKARVIEHLGYIWDFEDIKKRWSYIDKFSLYQVHIAMMQDTIMGGVTATSK